MHLIPHGSRRWRDTLEFRDRLRSEPALAAAYAALKLDLAQRFEFDRDAYTEAKWPFISQALGRSIA